MSIGSKVTFTVTKEKFDKIDQIIKDNPKILSSIDIAKINRPISYMTFYMKEIYDFMGLKTLDGVYYFELRNKNQELRNLRSQLQLLTKSNSTASTTPVALIEIQ